MEQQKIYKCKGCGSILEVIYGGKNEPSCCPEGLELLKENSVDAAEEKHVPVIEKTEEGYKVKVGSVAHPMEEEHFITMIELIADDKSYIQFLKPGQAPEAEFSIKANNVTAREYCNLHGLWKS